MPKYYEFKVAGYIQGFIKQIYRELYLKWTEYSIEGFYEK